MQNSFITYENETITYRIEKSKRKTISIAVLSDGSVVVRVPFYVSQTSISEIVSKKQDWILKKRREIAKQNEAKEHMDYLSYEDGSNLLYEGNLCPLHISCDERYKRAQVNFTGDSFHLLVNNTEHNFIKTLMRTWYRQQARVKFFERVEYFNNILRLPYGTIRIKEQKSCYGSCSSKGNLNFNWKCILAPPHILDYVVVHELCHLKYLNHSKQFWNLVETILPDYKERSNWLRKNGRFLDY